MSNDYAVKMMVARLHDIVRRSSDRDSDIRDHQDALARLGAEQAEAQSNVASLKTTLRQLGADPDTLLQERIANYGHKRSLDVVDSDMPQAS